MSNRNRSNRQTILVSADGGGFWAEMKLVLPPLREKYRVVYFLPEGSSVHDICLHPNEVVVHLPKFQDVDHLSILSLFGAFIRSIIICFRYRPTAVIAIGSSLILPFSFICRITSIKLIFIESLTRIHNLSRVGRFLYRFHLADRLYAQWPTLLSKYPSIRYKGRCL